MAISKKKISTVGEQLRKIREKASLPLREVATSIGIDTSLLAKIERNERQPTKQMIKQISQFFQVNEKELYNNYLSDHIANLIIEEEADLGILKIAETKVKYLKAFENGR